MDTLPSLTAAAYIRVSTEDQLEFSPDSQLKRIREYAVSHQLTLPDAYIFLDEGISGRSADNRPAFMNMIRAARQTPRPFDQILVWKFSRFARNRQDSIFYKSMLRKECGIDVISITEQLSDDPTSILIEALLEAMDEYYSINLAQEVRRGMNEKFSRGGTVGPPPFGYRVSQGITEPDPCTAPVVRLIFEAFLDGLSCRQIAENLNAKNIRTTRDNPFEARTIRYILGNPFYLGMQRRHLDTVSSDAAMTVLPAQHPPLIPSDMYAEVQKLLRITRRNHPSPASSRNTFLLKGLVRCSCCHSTLTRSGYYLQCCRYTRGQCPESHCISLPRLTELVLSVLETDFSMYPDLPLYLQSDFTGRKKSRELYPAFSQKLTLCRFSKLLRHPQLSEDTKNLLLRAIISEICFSRKDNTIRIHYLT